MNRTRFAFVLCVLLWLPSLVSAATWTSQRSGTWSVASNNAASPWYDNGAQTALATTPQNGDTITSIANGHNVTLDRDLSGDGITLAAFTISAGGTVTVGLGTSIKMNTNANLTVNGTLTDGSTDGVVAAEMSGTFIVYLQGTGDVTGSGIVNLRAQEPTVFWVRTVNQELVNATTIEIDTDLTADSIWDAGDEIGIVDVGGTLSDYQICAIDHIGADGGNHIELTAGTKLTAQKEVGSYIMLLTRNVRVVGTDGATSYGLTAFTTGTVWAEFKDVTSPVYNCSGMSLRFTSNSIGSSALGGGTKSCFLTNSILFPPANTTAVSSQGSRFKNCFVTGGSSASYAGAFTFCHTDTSVFAGSSVAVGSAPGSVFSNCTFTGNTKHFSGTSGFTCYNCTFVGGTDNALYTSNGPWEYAVSYTHNGAAGDFKSWVKGGITLDEDTTVPTGYDKAYKHTCESASYPCLRQEEFAIEPGETLRVVGQIKFADDHTGYEPRLEIIDCSADPLADSANAALATTNGQVTENGTNTDWQAVSLNYTNIDTLIKRVFIRASAQRATGDVYEAWNVLAGGGNVFGGSVVR